MKRFLVRRGADGELEEVAIRDGWQLLTPDTRLNPSDLDESRRRTLAGVPKSPLRKDKGQ